MNSGSVTKARVDECLTQVFGTAEGVNMQTVTLFDDFNFKPGYDISSFDYDAQTETFTIRRQGIQNDDPCLVTEIVNKAVSYSDRLEIYVTPMYIKTEDRVIDGATIKGYTLASGYDFQNQTFTDELISVRKEDYYNYFISGDTLDIDRYNYGLISQTIQEQRQDKLDIATLQQYKYTFTKNGDNYVLSSFAKVVANEEENPEQEGTANEANTTAQESTNTSSEDTESNTVEVTGE